MEYMTTGKKLSKFIDYIEKGGEVEINGRTYVWLDNHIISSRDGVDYGIDGFAIKAVSLNTQTGEEKPHFMGQMDMSISYLMDLVEDIKEEEWVGILASLALRGMNKKRQGV